MPRKLPMVESRIDPVQGYHSRSHFFPIYEVKSLLRTDSRSPLARTDASRKQRAAGGTHGPLVTIVLRQGRVSMMVDQSPEASAGYPGS